MTLRWSSCLSKVAKAHKPPYTAALLGDKSCTKTEEIHSKLNFVILYCCILSLSYGGPKWSGCCKFQTH